MHGQTLTVQCMQMLGDMWHGQAEQNKNDREQNFVDIGLTLLPFIGLKTNFQSMLIEINVDD